MTPRAAVFLDRDGVLIEHVPYLHHVEHLELTPGAVEAICALNAAGFAAVVVTNQSVVARGMCSEPQLREIHAALERMLQPARLDGVYYCPHLPPAENALPQPPYRIQCECRKPAPGMLQHAARELALDLGRSLMIGDSTSDVEAGRRAGAETALVRRGIGGPDASCDAPTAHFDDLAAAVRWWLARGTS